MSETLPWFGFNARRYADETVLLTAEAKGHYMDLVVWQWIHASDLPDDLRLIDRISPGVRKHWSALQPLYTKTESGWRAAWIEIEREQAKARVAKFANAGRLGGEAKARNTRQREQRRFPGGSDASSVADSDANSPATAQPLPLENGEGEKRETQPSSLSQSPDERRSNDTQPGARTTTDHVAVVKQTGPRLRAALQRIPGYLSPVEAAEAEAIIRTWPDEQVFEKFRDLVTDAADADVPGPYLMAMLRKRRVVASEPDRNQDVVGRIDAGLNRQKLEDNRVAIKLQADLELLEGYSSEALDRYRSSMVDAVRARSESGGPNAKADRLLCRILEVGDVKKNPIVITELAQFIRERVLSVRESTA